MNGNTSKILNWYQNLDQTSLMKIEHLYAKDAFFKDPFNEFNGVDNIQKIFQHMFEKMEGPKFIFKDVIDSERECFLTWDFEFKMKNKSHSIHGSSHLKLNEKGLISYHRDYWDVGEEVLMKIPFISFLYRKLTKSLSLGVGR